MSEAFAVFDVDKDGYITKSELRQVMNRLGENLTDAQLDAMIKEADSDKDGRIDINEFRSLMKLSVCSTKISKNATKTNELSFFPIAPDRPFAGSLSSRSAVPPAIASSRHPDYPCTALTL